MMSEPTDDSDETPVPPATDEGGNDNVVRLDFKRQGKAAATAAPEAQLITGRGGSEEKLRDFTEMVERGMVMVVLDARRFGVRVPARFAGELELRLNFSHKFQVPDFRYDERGVRASLSFQGSPFFCDIPWTAVYQLRSHVDNHVRLWPDDMPEELLAMIPEAARVLKQREDEKARRDAEVTTSPPATTPGASPTTSTESTEEGKPADAPGPDDPQPPKRPGLRLVKS
jgi:stringent starvation protein B